MLLAGDEFGNSQSGNNNAYAQDNEIGWLDWSGLYEDPGFLDEVRELVWLRRENPLLRLDDYVHGSLDREQSVIEIHWINKRGEIKQSDEWQGSRAFSVLIEEHFSDGGYSGVIMLINRYEERTEIKLPLSTESRQWHPAFTTGPEQTQLAGGHAVTVPGLSLTLLVSDQ